MAVTRYLEHDVDASLPFHRALGVRLAERRGPPFAVMKGHGLSAWLDALGVRFRARPIQGPGGRQALIDDPSGNPVEIFQPRDGV